VSQDLATQRPAVRTLGRVDGQHVSQPVLLALSLFQVIHEPHLERLGEHVLGVKRLRVGLD
jgi:hypothetical protein